MTNQGYVDLHLHALPGLDDGVRSISAAVEMLGGLWELGFDTVVTTPHRDFRRWFYSDDALHESYNAVSQALRDARIHIDLQLGCEYTYGEQFHGEISEQTARTIGNSNYVLLELPERTMPHAVPQALFQVSLAGYYPILAHPERCRPFQSNGEALSQLANGRALIQVSFRSLAGTFGRSIRKTAWRLVEEGTADLVATDCHSPREIKKIVTPVMKSLKNTLEPSHLDSLMGHYPRSMISGDKGEA